MYMDFAVLGTSQEEVEKLAQTNRGLRYSLRAVNTALMIEAFLPAIAPAVMAVGVITLSSINAFAQSTTGPIFTPDNGQFGKTVVGFVKLLYSGLFVMGFVGVAWFIFNLLMEKPWTKQLIGSLCCWGAGIIAMAVYNASKGRVVELDAGELGGGN